MTGKTLQAAFGSEMAEEMKTILVTGGAGFVGSYVAVALKREFFTAREDIPHYVGDYEKVHRAFNWKPEWHPEGALDQIVRRVTDRKESLKCVLS